MKRAFCWLIEVAGQRTDALSTLGAHGTSYYWYLLHREISMGLAIVLSHIDHSTGIDIFLGSATVVILNISTIVDWSPIPLLDKLLEAAFLDQPLWISGIQILDFMVELKIFNQLIGNPETHILSVAQHRLVEFFQVNDSLEWQLTIV